MLEGERNITAKSWYNGFKNVNLNPDHTQPIEVWLSTITEQLEASGATDRFLQSGYVPTVDEVELESNIQLLRAIKIPPKFAALSHSGKQKVCPADALVVSLFYPRVHTPIPTWQVMEMFSPRDGQAEWEAESITAAIAADADVKSLNLTSKDSLSKWYKYVEAMRGAVQCGAATVGDVVPDITKALRRRSENLRAIQERSRLSQASDESIGVSKNHDIESYSLASLGKSRTEHFEFMIHQRKLSNYTGNKALAALDLSCTTQQTMDLIITTTAG
jgi:hypothetical protein